jgi:hypothetical protein
MPNLSWIKSAGPFESNLIKRDTNGINQDRINIITIREKKISNNLLINLLINSFKGSSLTVITGILLTELI